MYYCVLVISADAEWRAADNCETFHKCTPYYTNVNKYSARVAARPTSSLFNTPCCRLAYLMRVVVVSGELHVAFLARCLNCSGLFHH